MYRSHGFRGNTAVDARSAYLAAVSETQSLRLYLQAHSQTEVWER